MSLSRRRFTWSGVCVPTRAPFTYTPYPLTSLSREGGQAIVTLELSVAVTSTALTGSGAPRPPCAPAARPVWEPIKSVATIATSVAADGRRRISMLFLSPDTPPDPSPHWGH